MRSPARLSTTSAREYGHHFGSIENFDLPTTQADCDRMWRFALENLLPAFGPYEDAMRDDQPQLFHSRTSALVNLGRLLPRTMIQDVEEAAATGNIPLASAEGFIRQLLGWREFMRHIHEQTDGYRLLDVAQERRKPAKTDQLGTSGTNDNGGGLRDESEARSVCGSYAFGIGSFVAAARGLLGCQIWFPLHGYSGGAGD